MIHYSSFIHPWAHVDRSSCKIGAGTKIHQFASVTRGTVLGEDCVVWPFAMLDGPIIGDRCKIASGVAMGAGFKLGNDVFIGPNVTFCNDLWPEASAEGFDDARLRGGEFTIIVESGASIGANAVIMPGSIIRSGAVIGAGEKFGPGNVPENMLYLEDETWPIPMDRRARRMRILP